MLLLEQTFIRSGLHVSYTLRDDTIENQTGKSIPYVRLEAVARYKVRNVGNAAVAHPVAVSLPNPLHAGLKAKCGVNRVTVRRKGVPEILDLGEAEKKFRSELTTSAASQAAYRLPSITLNPEEEIELIWDYVMAKEEEDTEIMQTLYPADSVTITVMDTNPSRRLVLARSLHPAALEDDSSAEAKGTYNFRLDRYLLPHQGFVIWWKIDQSGGNQERTPESGTVAS